jgi:hypothetical protein
VPKHTATNPTPPANNSNHGGDRPLSLLATSDISSVSNQSSFSSTSTSSSLDDPLEIQPIDKQQAWHWLNMAARLEPKSPDDPMTVAKARAQYKIGTICFGGDALTSPDQDKALHWFMQSADNRNK